MNRRMLLLIAACVVVGAIALLTRGGDRSDHPAQGQARFRPVSTNGSPGAGAHSGYDKFKLIHTRNIFDPDRRPIRTGPPAPTPPPARTDYVALTGTFFDGERKQLAFFSGTRPEYNKVLSVHEQIAGATINKITGANVEVIRNGHPITVAVGQTVPFDNSAPTAAPGAAPAAPAPAPGVAAGVGASTAAGVGPGTAPPDSAASAVPASPNASPSAKLDEIRRRMEERRRQEQK
jgi:hypothetical protein